MGFNKICGLGLKLQKLVNLKEVIGIKILKQQKAEIRKWLTFLL